MKIPCIQGEEIMALKVTSKYVMEKINKLDKKVDVNHEETKEMFNKIMNKIDDLPERFVMRREFKAVGAILGLLIAGIGVYLAI